MKVTLVIENHSRTEGIEEEYGLSLFVDTADGAFVLDGGAGEKARLNFEKLGLNYSQIDAIVLSHNHPDHVGGIDCFADNSKVPIYLSDSFFNNLYTKRFIFPKKKVSRDDLKEKYFDRLKYVDDQVEILPNVFACKIKKPLSAFVCKDKKLRVLKNNKLYPDDFGHEIYVAVKEQDSLKVLSPCSHNGIVNILQDAENRFGQLPVSFLGGLHFRNASGRGLNCKKQFVLDVADKLNLSNLSKLFCCHCTGSVATEIFQQKLKAETKRVFSGETLEF